MLGNILTVVANYKATFLICMRTGGFRLQKSGRYANSQSPVSLLPALSRSFQSFRLNHRTNEPRTAAAATGLVVQWGFDSEATACKKSINIEISLGSLDPGERQWVLSCSLQNKHHRSRLNCATNFASGGDGFNMQMDHWDNMQSSCLPSCLRLNASEII